MTKEVKEKWFMDITDKVRVAEHDTKNYTILRMEQTEKADGTVVDEFKVKGYYSTIKGCLKGILVHDILIDTSSINTLKDYHNQSVAQYETIKDMLSGKY